MPIADVQRIRAMYPDEMELPGPSKTLPRLPQPESKSPSQRPIKRRTADIKIPGAFPRSDSFDIEQNLDDHMRMIEVEFVTRRRQSKGSPFSDISASPREVLKPLSNNRTRRTDKMERRTSLSRSKAEMKEQKSTNDPGTSQTGLDHELNYRQNPTPSSRIEKPSRFPKKPESRRTEHTAFVLRDHTIMTNVRPGTAQPTSKVDPELKGFRRLSLGDISSTFEGLFR